MPQLDRIIIFTQLFWLFFIFLVSYMVLTHFFLPLFLKSIKSRKLVVEANLKESQITHETSLRNQIVFTQIVNEGLSTLKHFYSSKFLLKNTTHDLNLSFVDSMIIDSTLSILLHCDQIALESIQINSRSYKLYYNN
uniref:ATP synthase F0 subunit 8 n=1 Tax=Palmaria decipiens TaxID=187399 RepID=A0A6C0W3D5_PALDE|nr:ATP synthase F0 subunit 8 [Palmaria decipiens]QIC19664.1 ATP synthase F0 subunit 8 [Palmaria decipiens]